MRIFLIFYLFVVPMSVYADALDLYMRTFDVAISTSDRRIQKNSELYDRVTLARERENSLANRILGALAIGATGIGGMQLMSGLAEKNADEDAERDMRAYLATFRCDFGSGRSINGGDKNVELPTSPELTPLVNQYKELASNLKMMKESLGMKPGIESDVVIDAATTGLYDDVGVGKKTGAFTSVYRALTDENSADAQAWAEQKQAAQKKVKTGGAVAGVGAVGGMVGNLAINRDADKDKSNNHESVTGNNKDSKIKKSTTKNNIVSSDTETDNTNKDATKKQTSKNHKTTPGTIADNQDGVDTVTKPDEALNASEKQNHLPDVFKKSVLGGIISGQSVPQWAQRWADETDLSAYPGNLSFDNQKNAENFATECMNKSGYVSIVSHGYSTPPSVVCGCKNCKGNSQDKDAVNKIRDEFCQDLYSKYKATWTESDFSGMFYSGCMVYLENNKK